MVAEAEDLFKQLGRVDGKKSVVKEKSDISLRSVKIHHMEEELILQAMSGSSSSDLVADHKKHQNLEKRLKEPMGELGKNPIERKFLDLKREVRRLLTSHMADFDISALKKRAGKT